jgi:hypothetical protein
MESVLILIASGAHIEARDQHDTTPLLVAVQFGHRIMALALLDLGAEISHRDAAGRTCMHYAASAAAGPGGCDMLRLLSRRGASVDVYDQEGLQPLHAAALAGSADGALFLVQHCGARAAAYTQAPYRFPSKLALHTAAFQQTHSLFLATDLFVLHFLALQGGGPPPGQRPLELARHEQSIAQVSSLRESCLRCLHFLRLSGQPIPDDMYWRIKLMGGAPKSLWQLRRVTLWELVGPVAAPLATGLGANDTLPKLTRLDLIMEAVTHLCFGLLGSSAPSAVWQVRHIPFILWLMLVAAVITNLFLGDMQGDLKDSWLVSLQVFLFAGVILVECIIHRLDAGTVDPYQLGLAGGVNWEQLPRSVDIAGKISHDGFKPHCGAVMADGSLVDPVSGEREVGVRVRSSEACLMLHPARLRIMPDGLVQVSEESEMPHENRFLTLQVVPVDDSASCVAAAQLANALLAMGQAQANANVSWSDPRSDLSLQEFNSSEFVPSCGTQAMLVQNDTTRGAAILSRLLSSSSSSAPTTAATTANSPKFLHIAAPTMETTWSTCCQFLLQRQLSHVERLVLDSAFASGVGAHLRDEMVCFSTECVNPPRSKFDKVTGRRYYRFDHYCPWVHSVVAQNTHPWFLLYLVVHALACAVGVTFWMLQGWHIHTGNAQSTWGLYMWHLSLGRGALSVISLLCHSFGCALCAGLLTFHIPSAVLGNVTTNEASNASRYAHMWHFEPAGSVKQVLDFLQTASNLSGPDTDTQMRDRLKVLEPIERVLISPFSWAERSDNAREMFFMKGPRRLTAGRVRHMRLQAEALNAVAVQIVSKAGPGDRRGDACNHDHGHSHMHGHDHSLPRDVESGGAVSPTAFIGALAPEHKSPLLRSNV